MDQLTETQRNSTLALLNGANVIIDDIPAGGPYTQFNGIVEGWSETYVPGRHLLTLTLVRPPLQLPDRHMGWCRGNAYMGERERDPTMVQRSKRRRPARGLRRVNDARH